jgi:hypothetical protein
VVGIEVQSIKVEPFVFNFGPLGDFPSHGHKDICHFFHQDTQGVSRTRRSPGTQRGQIQSFLLKPGSFFCGVKFCLFRFERLLNSRFGLPHQLPRSGFLIAREIFQSRVHLRED